MNGSSALGGSFAAFTARSRACPSRRARARAEALLRDDPALERPEHSLLADALRTAEAEPVAA